MSTQPYLLTATEAASLIGSGELTSEELASSCLGRVRELEPTLHAWAYMDEGIALAAAREQDHRLARGEAPQPMHGVPLGVKDIFNTKGMPTEMGSPAWKGFTPGNDARVVETLHWHGCYAMGKTVTAEFGVHFPGPTLNPYDISRSPGTSSSGSAVAVASGMVPVALGSQTAGSAIRPASYCGIYGFKPSFGLLPRTGMLKTTDTLDHVALLARDVDDLRLLFDSARVSGQDHPMALRHLHDMAIPRSAKKPWRIALIREPKWGDAEQHARDAIEGLAGQLATVGNVIVEDMELSAQFSEVHDIHQTIYCKALSYYFQDEMQYPELVSENFRGMIEYGEKVTPQEYQRALHVQTDISALLDGLFESVDIVLTLATGGEALQGLDSDDRPDNCLIWTLCGVPALTAPAFSGPSGLPFGAQFIARKYHDYQLLQFLEELKAHGIVKIAPQPPVPDPIGITRS